MQISANTPTAQFMAPTAPPAAGFGGITVTNSGMAGRTVKVDADFGVYATGMFGSPPSTATLDAQRGAEL